jgi:hypothetical protein
MLAKANGLSQYSVAHVLSFRPTAMSGLESRCKVPRGPLNWGRRISAATRARGESSARWRRAIDAAFYNHYDPRTELGVPCSSPLLLARSTLWPGRQAIAFDPNFRKSLSRNRNRLSWICLEQAVTLT